MEEQNIIDKLEEIERITLLGVKEALTMNDVALFTGLSKSHIYKLVCKKKIPYYKSQGGKLTYFNKDELNSWMLQNRIKTIDELETEAADYLVTDSKAKKGGKHV